MIEIPYYSFQYFIIPYESPSIMILEREFSDRKSLRDMQFLIYSLFLYGITLAAIGDSGSSIYWPSLDSQCTTTSNILKVLNVTNPMENSDTCCHNGDKSNPTGNFPPAGTSEKGVYIGCAIDSENRPFVSAM